MARSAALNPASVPFFPSSLRGLEGLNAGSGRHNFRDQDLSAASSLSVSPPDPLSVKSSPSSPREVRETMRYPAVPSLSDQFEESKPTYRLAESKNTNTDVWSARDENVVDVLEPVLENKDFGTPGPLQNNATPARTPSSFTTFQPGPEEAQGVSQMGFSVPRSSIVASPSPVSSLDSGSQPTPNPDQLPQDFDVHLRTSPMMMHVLERLTRYEYTAREIQRDLGELHRKVNLLVERTLGAHSQPVFNDPFTSYTNGHPYAVPSVKHRPSIGNIAPNQLVPSDDVSGISQRLNTLTASVGQLLALQTQQIQTTTTVNSSLALNPAQSDVAPNQMLSNPSFLNPGVLAQSAPVRPEMRLHPNPPLRTWSAGHLDGPLRSDPNAIRQESLLRDPKRRSVSGLLRRESSAIIDLQSDNWGAGSPREAGPMLSKWEQLALAPELLRSLGKFGVGPPNKIQQRALPFLLRGADIIAQAPPTQERIAAYVIPAIQIVVTHLPTRSPNRGPIVVMISTTVDQATQAQRMIRDLGGPIGVRSALGIGAANGDISQEIRLLTQNMPHIICGTPQKLHALFTGPGGIAGSEVRFLVLDEVDQLIARNLHDFVFNIVKLLPSARSRPLGSNPPSNIGPPGPTTQTSITTAFESGSATSLFPSLTRRFYTTVSSPSSADITGNLSATVQRQTALFSNTVPQDVLNLASAIQLREPVRVLVRRDGSVVNSDTNQGSRGLRQFYLYLPFTAGARSEPMSATTGGGLGIIGSGRGASSAETALAREWKLDALADLFDDVEVSQAIVHVGGMTALDSVVSKLSGRGLETVPLHGDMNAGTKLAALNKFRNNNPVMMRQSAPRILVVYDVQVKIPEVSHVPLIINYDLPKAVEEYAHRVAPAIASNYARAGIIINFITATGGDVEMLRSIECFYKIKCPEVPLSLRDIV